MRRTSAQSILRRHTPRIVKTAFAGQVIYHFDVPDIPPGPRLVPDARRN